MNGWLWVGVAFLFLAWTIGAYAYGRAIGFSLGMLVGQHSARLKGSKWCSAQEES